MKLKNYILLTISTLTLAGCTSEDITNTPNDERIPLRIEATLSGDRPVTRAIGKDFENDDVIKCYIQHVYSDTKLEDATTYKIASQANLVSYKYGEATKFYWDDFSNAGEANGNLLDDNHGLRSVYGYCYNGGTPKSEPKDEAGELTWKIPTTQSDATTIKKNDLLWSPSQKPVKYSHGTSKEGEHGTLTIPFTHAMSKFTIVIKAGEGFSAGALENTVVKLKNINTEGSFVASTGNINSATGVTDVTMYSDATNAKTATIRTYEAITIPLTELKTGEVLAEINDVDGNNYQIKVTDNILGTTTTKWGEGLTADNKTQSGYNYSLEVNLAKQAVDVDASLANWIPVDADGTGEIQFTANVTSSSNTTTTSSSLSNGTFKLWKISDLTETALAAAKTTTVTYDGSAYTYNPTLYWQNATDNSYFRAMATMTTTESSTSIAAPTTTDVNQNIDLLWGTTADHTGKEADNATTHHYDEGAAINPRTGEVPLVFKHAMSKVVFDLKTTDETTDPQYVDLSYATIELTNLATSGTISIANGSITLGSIATSAITGVKSNESKIMVPQEIGSTAVLKINLNDNTTAPTKSTSYSLSLADCENTDGKITEWESGKQYTYTITLKKEAVKFRVLVQDWTETKGSGNATLDWD